jgi:hypothetical protein
VRFVDDIEQRLMAFLHTHAELIRREPDTAANLERIERRCLDDARRRPRMARMTLRLVPDPESDM